MRALICVLLLTGCATTVPELPADAFFARLSSLCGRAYAGRVVSTEAADADMRGKPLVMHVRTCTSDEIRIPFYVGDDRSRTWVVTRTDTGLRLKHDHRHADGSEDVLTQYGGDSGAGTGSRYMFPADAFSQSLFRTKGNPASVTNVWAIDVEPGHVFAYELRRQNRFFRVDFDLSRPVTTPPPPWGSL